MDKLIINVLMVYLTYYKMYTVYLVKYGNVFLNVEYIKVVIFYGNSSTVYLRVCFSFSF